MTGEMVGDPLEVAKLQHLLGTSQMGLGYPGKAVALLSAAYQTRLDKLGLDDDASISTAHQLAMAHQAAGDLTQALEMFEQLLEQSRELHGATHLLTATAMNK